MEYKVTYYVLPINNELVISQQEFKSRTNKQQLTQDIEQLEIELEDKVKLPCYVIGGKETIMTIKESQKYHEDNDYPMDKKVINPEFVSHKISVKNKEINFIEMLRQKMDFSINRDVFDKVNKLIQLKIHMNNINNTFFTDKDLNSLNEHIKSNAKEGWKLTQVQPINKNVSFYTTNGLGSDSSESVAQIQEGFILFWEMN